MKKRKFAVIGLLTLCLAVSGCSKNEEKSESSVVSGSVIEETSQTEESAVTDTSDIDVINTSLEELLDGIDVDACVVLGEYTGLELTKEVEAVTDEDVENTIADKVASTLLEVDDAAAEGDTVNIDYVGKLDGEAFDGGTGAGYDLVLGSDTFIDGFEDGLIGSKAGDSLKLNLTFPAGYSEELGGKDVVFEVTVNAVKRAADGITEEWVTKNTEFASVDEYTRDIRQQLESGNESTAVYNLQSAAWQSVVDQATIKEYPEKLVAFGSAMYQNQIESYCAYFGVSLDEYLSTVGMGDEEFEETKQEYGKNIAAQILVMSAIETAEGMSNEDPDYQDKLDAYVEESGMDEESFIASYGAFNVEQSIMMERITEFIIANSNVTEKTVDSDAEASGEDASQTSEAQETEEE